MPAKSDAQRKLMAIAEHHPDQVSAKNRGVLKMNKGQLHDFASTKGLKKKGGKKRKRGQPLFPQDSDSEE